MAVELLELMQDFSGDKDRLIRYEIIFSMSTQGGLALRDDSDNKGETPDISPHPPLFVLNHQEDESERKGLMSSSR